jgi:Tfp pilus assembly protein PilO
MKRSHIILGGLAAVLAVAVFWVTVYSPKQEQIEELEVAIAAEELEQQQLEAEIARLRSVRDQAPEVEAELAAAEAIVPRDGALPAALRQLQVAADDSGALLQAVTTSRPVQIDGAPAGLSRIETQVQLVGGYFQVVDFLRRIEDPEISPRGLNWTNVTVSREEYPQLNVSLAGALYASLPAPPPIEELGTDAEVVDGENGEGEEGTETDVDPGQEPNVEAMADRSTEAREDDR